VEDCVAKRIFSWLQCGIASSFASLRIGKQFFASGFCQFKLQQVLQWMHVQQLFQPQNGLPIDQALASSCFKGCSKSEILQTLNHLEVEGASEIKSLFELCELGVRHIHALD